MCIHCGVEQTKQQLSHHFAHSAKQIDSANDRASWWRKVAMVLADGDLSIIAEAEAIVIQNSKSNKANGE